MKTSDHNNQTNQTILRNNKMRDINRTATRGVGEQ